MGLNTVFCVHNRNKLNPNERYITLNILRGLLVVTVSLTGHITVLTASIKYNAIKLDKMSTTLIRHVSVTDLCFTVMIMLILVGYFAEANILGPHYCWFLSISGFLFASMDTTLVCTLNISKLTCLLFPLRARLRSRRTAQFVAGILWAGTVALIASVAYIDIKKDTTLSVFAPVILSCVTVNIEGETTAFDSIYIFNVTVKLVVMVVTTAWLFWYVHNVRGLHKQGVLTLLLISTAFFVSYLPYVVLLVLKNFVLDSSQRSSVSYYRFVSHLSYLLIPCVAFLSLRNLMIV